MRGGLGLARSKLLGCVLVTCAVGAIAPASASAVVNVTPGSGDVVSAVDGICSLREAVISDNSDFQSGVVPGECPGGQDGVSVPPGNFNLTMGLPGEEDLSAEGDLDLTGDSSVAGAGPDLTTITQNVLGERVIHLDGLTGTTASPLTNLTIAGGSLSAASGNLYGAGVFVDGDASASTLPDLKDVRVGGNSINATGTAIAHGAGVGANTPVAPTALRLEDVKLENNDVIGTGTALGGGVSADALLELTRAWAELNDATGNDAQGGAVWAGGVSMNQSVIVDNTASAPGAVDTNDGAFGGGIFAGGQGSSIAESTVVSNDVSANGSGQSFGGGVFLDTGLIDPLTNVTFHGNGQTGGAAGFQGGGGIASEGAGQVELSFVTFVLNSAVIGEAVAALPSQTIEFRASAIDGSPTNACGTAGGAGGTFTSLGENAGVGATCVLTDPSDAVLPGPGGLVSAAPPTDNTGGAAAYQAGAGVFKRPVGTNPPGSSSPVIDRVDACTDAGGATVFVDARGVSRPQPLAARCDSGAMEVEQFNAPPTAQPPAATPTPTPAPKKKCKKGQKRKKGKCVKKKKKR